MTTVSREEVDRVRRRIAQAQELAAERFRQAFAAAPLPPTAHLEIQAAALLESAEHIRIAGQIRYQIDGSVITPYVTRGAPIYPFFDLDRTAVAVFEYWLVVSEIVSSTSWRMTRVIADAEEYDAALRLIQSPQIVRALVVSFLPEVDIRDDGSAMLAATVYTRAQEERVERRTLFLDASNEFHFHGRELIAEGRGGIPSS